MGVRIGYVNVRGLSREKGKHAGALLDAGVDLLFLAETWYVDHAHWGRDRRFVAATRNPQGDGYRRGRSKGGIYLLATAQARGRIQGPVRTDEHAITVAIDRQTITAVYYPPSLPPASLTEHLGRWRRSTVVLGDINTRFADTRYQRGTPGPADRLEVMAGFLDRTRLTQLKPHPSRRQSCWPRSIHLEPYLTTDHCFVHATIPSPQLSLWSTATCGIRTDHLYLLHLTLGATRSEPTTTLQLPRYRIHRLRDPAIEARLRLAIQDQVTDGPSSFPDGDLDGMNDHLVTLYQQVCRGILGVVRKPMATTGGGAPSGEGTVGPDPEEQSMLASIRLYKRAAASSGENTVIVPTPRAQRQGQSAVEENREVLQERYRGRPVTISAPLDPLPFPAFTREDVVGEIHRQDGSKGCGADGVHIRVLKTWTGTIYVDLLVRLFQYCTRAGQTPKAWNRSEIHLLTKDPTRPRDADNLRPITMICIFRKVFEKLLLTRFDEHGWAALHPAQAGFRSRYSTYTNVAVVHHLLRSQARSTAVFLDFRAAFDVLDHARLMRRLEGRGCPTRVRSLVAHLMCRDMRSRVLVNSEASDWFDRTQGVLQGSPLSPYLFNIFIDDLVALLNRGAERHPICLFYADDGVLVTPSWVDVQGLLNEVSRWSRENGLGLNVRKCGCVSRLVAPPLLYLGEEQIPMCDSYTYLGFPMTATGVDFATHVRTHMAAAVQRAQFLTLYSRSWGVAHRLRVAKQYLMPMVEFGAPLIWVWRNECARNRQTFEEATVRWKELLAWIGNVHASRHQVLANLLGLCGLEDRFQRLRTAYQATLMDQSRRNPLSRLLDHPGPPSQLTRFVHGLCTDPGWQQYQAARSEGSKGSATVKRYLQEQRRRTLMANAQRASVTRLIPWESRQVPGLGWADRCLRAPKAVQELLLQYRQGLFMFNAECRCGPTIRFHRGHEKCFALINRVRLTPDQERRKEEMEGRLGMVKRTMTDIDWMLNAGEAELAAWGLIKVKEELQAIHFENEKKRNQMSNRIARCS